MEHDNFEIVTGGTPNQICPISGRRIKEPAIMHRDLSDFWSTKIADMRNDNLSNILIVDRDAREAYYKKIKDSGVVLALSGGLDSVTVLHWAATLFGEVHCLIFDYGQKHKIEIDYAVDCVRSFEKNENNCKVTSSIINMSPINDLASSALTRPDKISVPSNQNINDMGKSIPVTFVPGRNIYFMTALAQVAYAKGFRHIALGVNVLDYSGYPDCRPEFIVSMREALSIGIFNGIDLAVHAPLINLSKVQIIRLGLSLGVDYSKTHSCYNGIVSGCGTCDSCILRRKAFELLGMTDPALGFEI